MTNRIADPTDFPRHIDAMRYFNRLIIDLKHIAIRGEPVEPITMERLEEGSKHLDDLERCRERTKFY